MLVYVGPPGKKPYLKPDRMDNIRHDVPDGRTIVVRDRNGFPICGRVVDGATEKWELIADNWEWRA